MGTLTLAASLMIFLGPWLDFVGGEFGTYLENFGHFRIAGILLSGIGIILVLRKRVFVAVGIILLLCHLLPILSYSYPRAEHKQEEATHRFVFANIGWPEYRNLVPFTKWLEEVNPDVIAINEFDSLAFREMGQVLKKYFYYTGEIRLDRFGLALFSKKPLVDQEIVRLLPEDNRPSIKARIEGINADIWVVLRK